MTAIEAMACGTPTVVTTHGGLFRALRFGISGLYADAFDAMDLGITILKPLRHPPLAERLSCCGAETARTLFTWTGVAEQLLATSERLRVDQWTAPVEVADLESSKSRSEPKASNS
jgi:mannosylfructose-phosphate synthase